ncbi:hypothetical protein EJB05_19147 [Eragrostis curvula]|uniref:F-box domain-containing protein n=1 Tax=Eragrostis curvula TaxID=38414 RepID=A0A5J9UWL6_9POAL|nr:hypothetical protein EJB05_19147 [Eragrostis curvula]
MGHINQKESQVDRFSKLPNDILLNILDQLDVREAARTSVLSKRWRQLPAMLSRLIIDVNNFLPKGVFKPSIDELVHINLAVVEATRSMLSQRKSNQYIIHLLRVTFHLRDGDSISIGHTVGHTMTQQNIETAEFIILTEKATAKCTGDDLVGYGKQFMSFFYACPDAFGGLTRLHLKNLRFGELDAPKVLSTCKRLRHLLLHNCDSGAWTILQFIHSQLIELSIFSCRFERIELSWLPKLARLTFEGWISFEDPLFFGYVPVLEVLSLGSTCLSWHKMVTLSKFLDGTSVQDLTLNFKSEKIWVQPEDPKRLASMFHKLRSVNLIGVPEGYDLTWTMFILDAAPSLKELYITVWDHICEMGMDEERRRADSCSEKNVEWEGYDFEHQSLTTLTIFNFQPEDYFVRYIRRVMEVAVNLDDIFLYKRPSCGRCWDKYPGPSRYPSAKKQRCSLRNKIAQGTGSLAVIHFPALLRSDHAVKERSARSVCDRPL